MSFSWHFSSICAGTLARNFFVGPINIWHSVTLPSDPISTIFTALLTAAESSRPRFPFILVLVQRSMQENAIVLDYKNGIDVVCMQSAGGIGREQRKDK
ncbi:uncharacterized protein B0I36DRAFT_72077 [Microdochium trichocladiopsis]|uniref:Uncharacterized protein n=1 Tax=Microdochium trichocladiopsis TaxID=1682393 RepID=A0A9P8YH42_9PEZI|nr:uncharacterized protein B0I36DRAFT_72077 [Microdochium trichocladiopsis]KAH7037854.1 hypothetical protein B0I36DRAFT_72077 [Microdochium trichocladiopsis]